MDIARKVLKASFNFYFDHALSHLCNGLSSDQGNRAGLLILMGGKSFCCPQVHVSIWRVGTTIHDTDGFLEGLTHTISIMHVAQAWLP